MRRLFSPLVLAVPLLLSACATPQPASTSAGNSIPTATNPPGETAEAVRVFDGDSLEVRLDDGSRAEVRLLGINAPEGDECFGDQARAALEQWLDDTEMTLVADDEESDQFGRTLRYIFVDGTNVNLALLESGNALAIQTGHSFDEVFAENSDAAAAEGLGMWAKDACGETDLPTLEIVDYVFDPRGRDADNPNQEWVAIANRDGTAIPMDGWTLRDESTKNRFRFPDGFILEAGAEVLIRSGCGADSRSDLYWCAADPVWSNGGDTIVLQSADGTVIARDRYAGSY